VGNLASARRGTNGAQWKALLQINKKIAASAPSQGVVAGTETLCRAGWRRNRGDKRRHIASALPRGSEGAPAISIARKGILRIARTSRPQCLASWYLPSVHLPGVHSEATAPRRAHIPHESILRDRPRQITLRTGLTGQRAIGAPRNSLWVLGSKKCWSEVQNWDGGL